jgi:SAM-dependent methyltransferase
LRSDYVAQKGKASSQVIESNETMSDRERRAHWEGIYQTKGEREVSWFQETPRLSLEFIQSAGVRLDAPIIDIGGGASRLVDALLDAEFENITVLDISEKALAKSKSRLGPQGARIRWVVSDVTSWNPMEKYVVWHDRAAFHFLIDPNDRAAYLKRLLCAVRPGGHVIIGTFALDGPEKCSGLPVVRYDAASLGAVFGHSFDLLENRADGHQTPMGVIQRFQFSYFRRLNES